MKRQEKVAYLERPMSPSAFWGNDIGRPTHAQKVAWPSIGWKVISRVISTDKKTGLVIFAFSENDFPTNPTTKLREANPRASKQSKPTVFKNYSTSNFLGTHAVTDISQAIGHFRAKSNPQDRYSSFDYCYNYFYTNEDPTNELEKSCLVLGFYLASWGMLRGSSFLLEKSAVHFKPLIKYLSTIKRSTWEIDVDFYSTENIEEIIRIYSNVKQLVISNREAHLTLVTKILLGVFGFIPAFDQYFPIRSKTSIATSGVVLLG
ncbi:hypothetical protein [Dyadobacter sp. BHUBP1]|uniref:hypothetical protein n=1 Tax=Dyadobacter sp. BHUBP1 TaxID=3424178 RepID=UPI003D32D128